MKKIWIFGIPNFWWTSQQLQRGVNKNSNNSVRFKKTRYLIHTSGLVEKLTHITCKTKSPEWMRGIDSRVYLFEKCSKANVKILIIGFKNLKKEMRPTIRSLRIFELNIFNLEGSESLHQRKWTAGKKTLYETVSQPRQNSEEVRRLITRPEANLVTQIVFHSGEIKYKFWSSQCAAKFQFAVLLNPIKIKS